MARHRRIITSGLDPLSAVQVFEEGGQGAHDVVSAVSTATSTDGLIYFFTSPRIMPRNRTLNLAVNENGIVSATDIVSNPSDVAISWSAVSNSPWLSLQSNVGAAVNSADGSLTLSAASAALTPGSYVGTVTLTSTSHHLHMAVPVTVNLTVTSTRVFIDAPVA